jgi:4-diphosphocytidyl-2-C-methyl-D-erythritol kinase
MPLKKTAPSFSLAAPAKINFTLEVLGKRLDGFHEVRMLMAGVSLFDELSFEAWDECVLESDHPSLDCGAGNIILKAARLLQKKAGKTAGARMFLKKRIPIGAGLAGGSTDAAAALKGLNRLWDLGLDMAELSKLGAQLGSDIPFCLESGWAVASGRGEKLKLLSQRKKFHLVLLNPGFEVSTKWAYQNVDSRPGSKRNLSALVYEAIDAKDFERVNKLALNDLERVTAREYSEVGLMRQSLTDAGAVVTRMSGSGPTVWGLFKDEAGAEKAEKSLKSKYKFALALSTISKIPAKL